MKKTITILTPTYNEVGNIDELYIRISKVIVKNPNYKFEHLFIDNASNDGSIDKIKEIAKNQKNFKDVADDVKAENDLIKKGLKIDFNGVSLDIKKSKEKIERKFQRDKKNKSNFKSKRSYGGSQRDFKGRSDRRSKSKGRYNN